MFDSKIIFLIAQWQTLVNHKDVYWFKHILLVNTNGLGVAKLRRKPSPKYTHTFTPLNTYIYQEMRYQITYTICIPWLCISWGCVLSASLFSIYDSGSENENYVIIKYENATVILGLLGENDGNIEHFYTSEIDCFNHWLRAKLTF